MNEKTTALKRYHLRPLSEVLFDGAGEAVGAPSFPFGIWVSDELDTAVVTRIWAMAVNDSQIKDLSIFMATEEAGLFDVSWQELCKRAELFDRALNDTPLSETLPCPDWACALVEHYFSNLTLLGLLRKFGVNTLSNDVDPAQIDEDMQPLMDAIEPPSEVALAPGDMVCWPRRIARSGEHPHELIWPIHTGEHSSRIIVCEGHPAIGPLRLGWMWTEEMAAQIARLWKKWHAIVGFRPVRIGMATLEAYAEAPPHDLQVIRTLVLEQLSFCPDLGQEDAPVVSSLLNVLGHQWSFWWD